MDVIEKKHIKIATKPLVWYLDHGSVSNASLLLDILNSRPFAMNKTADGLGMGLVNNQSFVTDLFGISNKANAYCLPAVAKSTRVFVYVILWKNESLIQIWFSSRSYWCFVGTFAWILVQEHKNSVESNECSFPCFLCKEIVD